MKWNLTCMSDFNQIDPRPEEPINTLSYIGERVNMNQHIAELLRRDLRTTDLDAFRMVSLRGSKLKKTIYTTNGTYDGKADWLLERFGIKPEPHREVHTYKMEFTLWSL